MSVNSKSFIIIFLIIEVQMDDRKVLSGGESGDESDTPNSRY